MNTLFVVWQDAENRQWHPVGRLTHDGGLFTFVYTQGAKLSPGFRPFGRMTDLFVTYTSTELLPLFANRLVSPSRPEYADLLRWTDIEATEDTAMTLLAATEGMRQTDSLMVFPCPTRRENNTYRMRFFSHGIRHLPKRSIERLSKLAKGDQLYLMLDIQNEHDEHAIALRTDDPPVLAGYCPRYLTTDFGQIVSATDSRNAAVMVEKVNADAPTQFRLLCSMTGVWPKHFEPCSGQSYQPMVSAEVLGDR